MMNEDDGTMQKRRIYQQGLQHNYYYYYTCTSLTSIGATAARNSRRAARSGFVAGNSATCGHVRKIACSSCTTGLLVLLQLLLLC